MKYLMLQPWLCNAATIGKGVREHVRLYKFVIDRQPRFEFGIELFYKSIITGHILYLSPMRSAVIRIRSRFITLEYFHAAECAGDDRHFDHTRFAAMHHRKIMLRCCSESQRERRGLIHIAFRSCMSCKADDLFDSSE